MISQRELDYAYIAGCMDSDGSFDIKDKEQKGYFSVSCDLKQAKIETINIINKYFKSSIKEKKLDNNNWKDQYYIYILDYDKIRFLKEIPPYLLMKKELASYCMEMQKDLKNTKAIVISRDHLGRIYGSKLPEGKKEYRKKIYNKWEKINDLLIEGKYDREDNSFYENKSKQIIYAYIAGLMDGDGTFVINRSCSKNILPRYTIAIEISQINFQSIYFIKKKFNCSLYTKKPNLKKNKKKQYRIHFRIEGIIEFLEDLIPYLYMKRQQAKNLLILQQNINEYKYLKGKALPQSVREFRHQLYLKNGKLNATGKNKYQETEKLKENIFSKSKKLTDFL